LLEYLESNKLYDHNDEESEKDIENEKESIKPEKK
jgi:hypothetical protein